MFETWNVDVYYFKSNSVNYFNFRKIDFYFNYKFDP